METPTRFDLNTALAGWHQELAAQPHLAADDRRELETHLSDVMSELRQRGLNDEEAFWLARRRVGQPQRIAEEYASEDPAKVWRERTCWLAMGLFAMHLWSGWPMILLQMFKFQFLNVYGRNFFMPDWVLYYLPFLRTGAFPMMQYGDFIDFCSFLPLILAVILFARGRLERIITAWQFIFQSRRHLLITAVVFFAIYYSSIIFAWSQYPMQIQGHPGPHWTAFVIRTEFANACVSALFLGLIVWLMPAEQRASKSA